jgi:small subunit ribosomal protein S17
MKKNNNTIHKKFEGKVVSVKMDKTIVIRIDRLKKHPVYNKRIKISKRFKAHDEKNEAKLGDFVEIEECRPISKEKKWKLSRIIRKTEKERKDEKNILENDEENN